MFIEYYFSQKQSKRLMSLSGTDLACLVQPVECVIMTSADFGVLLRALLKLEIALEQEYLALVVLVASALDVLQGDTAFFLGFVLQILKIQLTAAPCNVMHLSLFTTFCPFNILVCPPNILTSLHQWLKGINKPFECLFEDSESVIAAVSQPKFKLGLPIEINVM